MHLVLSSNILYPYLINFHYFTDTKLSVKSSGLGPDGLVWVWSGMKCTTTRGKKSSIENNWNPNLFLVQKTNLVLNLPISFMPISREHLQVFLVATNNENVKEMFCFPLGSPNEHFLSTCFAFFYVFKLLHFPFSFKFQIGFFNTSFNIFRNLHYGHKETL